ncbi:MAG TPA: histidine kinase [Sphingobacterium sp.]|nr:histidine kinase [Sphingobacterium sp.]
MKIHWKEFLLLSGIYLFFFITIAHDVRDSQLQQSYQYKLFAGYATVALYILYIYPRLFSKEHMFKWVLVVVATFLMQSFAILAIQQWIPIPDNKSIPAFALSGMIFLGLLVYTGIKSGILAIRHLANKNVIYGKVLSEFFISIVIGLFILFPIFQVYEGVATITGIAVPFCYTLFALHYYFLFPYLDQNKAPKLVRTVLSILTNILCIVVFSALMELILTGFSQHRFASLNGLNILSCLILALILTPVIHSLYFHQNKHKKQVFDLKTELGKTSADLKLLQSQINPHFLFNAMNTLYGIALQENAERTSTGIQKLSDMMRFMLHENQKDSILLVREMEYIKEYIDLQKLRIANLSSIQITVNLPDEIQGSYHIAPMLLIPFIENAFKHGISLNRPSWIRVQLYMEGDTLKLSVYNSIHHRDNDSDPELTKSGIGLDNVKSRLQMLYSGRHELHIEETHAEYFVFLTIVLTRE